MLEVVDADALRRWYRSSLGALEASQAEIDSLNVFPVADADTGTNLFLTLQSAGPGDGSIGAFAKRCLLGARGSSGVILSQLVRGIAEVLGTQRRPPRGLALTEAFERAVTLAYAAVAEPVEGTMLTVARAAAEAARATQSDRLDVVVAAAARAAHEALAGTTAQLDVLTRAGVVDAGGRGIVVLLDALEAVIDERELSLPTGQLATPTLELPGPLSPAYEVMYLIDTADDRVPALRAALNEIGEAVVVSGSGGLWNVHVHTDDGPAAIELGVAAGRPYDIRVTEINDHRAQPVESAGRAVVIVVAPGSEALVLRDLLTRSGAHVIEATTTDPSAIGAELRELGCREVVMLVEPGLAAAVRSAAGAPTGANAAIGVFPVAAGVQLLSAVAVHDPHRRLADDVAAMEKAASSTRVATVGPAPVEVLCVDAVAEIERLLADGGDLVTVVAAAEIGRRIADVLADRRPDVDVNQLTLEALGSVVWLGVE
ncbi:MAG TPA: DAK2 domain-containing protein [Acidothermaceae bacterium]|nr:DAK2 domain-containing protein [Acidothermaceae bacterium]